jgi:DNA-binding MarR family transcriptional regulator
MDRFEHFTLSVFSITRYWNKIATEEMREHGLKGAYVLYLITLSDLEEPPTAARLAELTQRDKADVSRAIAIFQKKGFVEPYGENRYRAAICLTEAGKALARNVRQKADCALAEAGQGLSEEMRRDMYQSLDIIAGNMKEICEKLT